MEKYYAYPQQVMFFDPSNKDDGERNYCAGIAYKDEIICACCGGIINTTKIIELTPNDTCAIVSYKDWYDFAETIEGDVDEIADEVFCGDVFECIYGEGEE